MNRPANKSKRKKIIIAIVVLLISISAAAYWYYSSTKQDKTQYMTAPVTQSNIEDSVIAGGTVQALEMVDVGAQATGQVQRLYVQLGQKVKKGDLIAEIHATQQRNTLKDEETNYQSLLAQHDTRKSHLEQARTELASQKIAYDGGVLPKLEYQKFQNAVTTAENELKASSLQLQQARLKIDTAKTNLGYARITAPIDGVVVSVVTKQGQTINALQSTPTIVRLAQIDTVQIKAKFSEADVPKLKLGMPAHFTILGLPNKQFDAVLDSLELSPNSGGDGNTGAVYYAGLLNVANPEHELFIGMTANVTVMINQQKNVLSIPTTALGEESGDGVYKVRVLTEKDGKQIPEEREVKIGLNNRVNAQVLSGLKAGEQVIVSESDGQVKPLDGEGL
ncbi:MULTISPECIES: efflux RND transporter periplasmic adaptor subunit [unclassified Acinetobacter]|uniref:efflux RND transporter periplasmic adaptor subunit n=1 Tax=unclassified Acinetobacter TaxID=196816 RepID=UPI0035BA7F4C